MMTPEQGRGEPWTPEEPDLVDYAFLRGVIGFVLFRAPLQHKRLAAYCFLSVVAAAIVALQVLPKRWEVQASVLAQSNPLAPGPARDADRLHAAKAVGQSHDNLLSLLNQTNFVERHMASRAPASRARDRLLAALGRVLTPEERLEGLVDAVEKKLWVLARPEGTITFGFVWSNPELAFDIIKGALENFVETRKAIEVSSFSESISILEVHVANAQREIAVLSQRLADKQQKLRGSVAPKRTPLRIRPSPNAELAKLDALLEAKKRAYGVLEDFRERRLAELRSELAQQQNVYAPAHPILVATKRNLEALSRPSSEMEPLRMEIADLEREIKSRGSRPGESVKIFQEGLAEARLRLDDEDPRLEQERNELRLAFRSYTTLLADISAARVAQDIARVGFKYRYIVVSPPQMPNGPIWPNPLRTLAMALVGGVLFAMFAAAAAGLRTGTVIERWQVTSQLAVPVLAEFRGRDNR